MKFEILLEQLYSELNKIRNSQHDIIQQANSSIVVCNGVLHEMSQYISSTCFIEELDEIRFFKNVKVHPLSEFIYFSEIRTFEMRYPKISTNDQSKYIRRKIKKVNKFFDYNTEFIQYIKQDSRHLDALYYTRKNRDSLNITNSRTYYRAPEFSTSHDILLSKVRAYDNLVNYLENRLYALEKPKKPNMNNIHKKTKLHWNSSKTALTELVYGLHSSGAIDADISEIATAVEEFFNIDLGNYYRTLSDIKMRKTTRTKFIDKMRDSLEKKIDEDEE